MKSHTAQTTIFRKHGTEARIERTICIQAEQTGAYGTLVPCKTAERKCALVRLNDQLAHIATIEPVTWIEAGIQASVQAELCVADGGAITEVHELAANERLAIGPKQHGMDRGVEPGAPGIRGVQYAGVGELNKIGLCNAANGREPSTDEQGTIRCFHHGLHVLRTHDKIRSHGTPIGWVHSTIGQQTCGALSRQAIEGGEPTTHVQ